MSATPLFGGAMSTLVPAHYIDASRLREVPDNQEVFVSNVDSDSIIVELVESPGSTTGDAIARFHFDALAHDNDAATSVVIDISPVAAQDASYLTATASDIFVLAGTQQIAKFGQHQPPDTVYIAMAVVRLPSVGTDIVVTYNHLLVPEDGKIEMGSRLALIRGILASLQILDYGLFGS